MGLLMRFEEEKVEIKNDKESKTRECQDLFSQKSNHCCMPNYPVRNNLSKS